MNMTNDGRDYGITQYRWPLDFELAGRALTLRSEEKTYCLRFQDREFIDCDGTLSQYEAIKLDADLHVVFFGETLAAAALDLARGTAAIRIGAEGPWDFCRVEGFGDGAAELPSYTDEMAGTHVRWCFGCERYMEHDYLPGGRCRSVWSPRADRVREVNAQYIRLSEGKYLVELDRTPPYRTDTPQGFSKVLLAQDWARLLTVGCIYSPTLNEFRLVSGYAMP